MADNETQGDRIAAGKATRPGLSTDSEELPKSLSSPKNTPSYKTAEDMGKKYGDKVTQYGRKTATKRSRKGGSK